MTFGKNQNKNIGGAIIEEIVRDLEEIKKRGNGYLTVFVKDGIVTDKHVAMHEKDIFTLTIAAIRIIQELGSQEISWKLHQSERKKEAMAMTKKILEEAGIQKNWECVPFEINKEYTWKGFWVYDEEEKEVPVECKFKVTAIEKDNRSLCKSTCHVEYTKGPYKGRSVKVPLEDMPPTVEERGD